jgi:hypothetical protein
MSQETAEVRALVEAAFCSEAEALEAAGLSE